MSWVRTLEVTTVASCAVNCSYCPQSVLKDAYRGETELPFEDFRRVVGRLPEDVVVHFSGFVEPWLNAECTEMLKYALWKDLRVAVYTTLIGMRDPEIVALALTENRSRVDRICIHLPDADFNMPLEPKHAAVDAFRDLPGVEWMAMGVSSVPAPRMNVWDPVDRAGNLTGKRLPLVRHKGPIRCSYTPTYEHNVMLPNGDVVLCCMDYALKHPIGNLFTQEWHELDRSVVAFDNRHNERTICRRCVGAERA